MQLIPYEPLLFFSVPSVILGIATGYLTGKQSQLSASNRVGMGLAISIIAGLIVALIVSEYREATSISYLLSIVSFIAGTLFGLAIGWIPSPHRYTHHIVYDGDEDEEFDREIEEALKGN